MLQFVYNKSNFDIGTVYQVIFRDDPPGTWWWMRFLGMFWLPTRGQNALLFRPEEVFVDGMNEESNPSAENICPVAFRGPDFRYMQEHDIVFPKLHFVVVDTIDIDFFDIPQDNDLPPLDFQPF